VSDTYEWLWAYVAIEPTTGTCVVLLLPAVTGQWLDVFLTHLRQETGTQKLGVVLDNAPSHKSSRVTWPEGITPLYLPPYSPELDPAEQIFKHLRQHLSNQIFTTIEQMEEALIKELHTFWDDPQVIVHMTNYPWWQAGVNAMLSLSS
jgi:transposase